MADASLTRMREAILTSRLAGLVTFLRRASRASTIARWWRTLRHWCRCAYLVRWTTATPEPNGIVLDPRASYTVGLIVAGLERAYPWIGERLPVAALRRSARHLGGAWQAAPIRLTSELVLLLVSGAAGYSLMTAPTSRRQWAVILVIGGLAGIGLFVDHSVADLKRTRIGRWAGTIIDSPESFESGE